MSATLSSDRLKSAIETQAISVSKLAKLSEVSRAQIYRLLRRDLSDVQDGTLRRLAAALNTEPASLTSGGALDEYRQDVQKQHETIQFRGLGIPDLQPQRLERFFVDPNAIEDRSSESKEDCGANAGNRWADPVSNSPASAVEAIESRDRVVVVGDPGSGKTTVLRWLAYKHAAEPCKLGFVPVYIRLPEYMRALEINEDADLVAFVAGQVETRMGVDPSVALVEAIKRQNCLILLDGLDEVGGSAEDGGDDQRARVLESILSFVDAHNEQGRGHKFVITSRIVGFDRGPWVERGFSVLRILRYRRKQQEEAANKWAEILSKATPRPKEVILESIRRAIFSNTRVRFLASNPLILTILIRLNESRGGTLPRRRVDLYDKVVDVFLDEWERSKRVTGAFEETADIELDGREFRWLLSSLAWMMQKTDRTLAQRWWIADRIREYLQDMLMFNPGKAKDSSDRIIRYLTERTGLIEERGLDLFGFSHRTLQAYFAALGAIDEADASTSRDVRECVRPFYYRPEWSEVIRLIAAQLTPPVAQLLIADICEDPDPVGRFLKRGPLLALRCLSDGTSVPNRRRVEDIFGTLSELGRKRWLRLIFEAIAILEEFDGTRLEELAKETKQSIEETALRELPAEDAECVADWIDLSNSNLAAEIEEFGPNEAARDLEIPRDGRPLRVACFNDPLRLKNPRLWLDGALSLLRDEQERDEFKTVLIREISRSSASNRRFRGAVRQILKKSCSPALRASAASALASTSTGVSVRNSLVRVFESDTDERVRAACAASLGRIAVRDEDVRERLLQALKSDDSTRVRAGAASGLSDVAEKDLCVRQELLNFASQTEEPEKLRVSCAWALEDLIEESDPVKTTFQTWLETRESSGLQRVSAQVLADAIASEKIQWDHHVVERVEHILMNLDEPCPHALRSLEALADARERRRGLRLESVLRESLESLLDRIELAFVFGSTARGEQLEESDIDLMLIGTVSLKDLTAPLRNAERILGRRISPVIHTSESFGQRHGRGDPFLIEVCRREKIPIMRSGDVLSREELDDELRAMVADQMAATQ